MSHVSDSSPKRTPLDQLLEDLEQSRHTLKRVAAPWDYSTALGVEMNLEQTIAGVRRLIRTRPDR